MVTAVPNRFHITVSIRSFTKRDWFPSTSTRTITRFLPVTRCNGTATLFPHVKNSTSGPQPPSPAALDTAFHGLRKNGPHLVKHRSFPQTFLQPYPALLTVAR